MKRTGVAVAGMLAGWALAFGLGRLLYVLAGDSLVVSLLGIGIWLAGMAAGGIVAVRRYNLRHGTPRLRSRSHPSVPPERWGV